MKQTHQELDRFKERLLTLMDQKHHWAWTKWTGPQITKKQLKLHYQQEFAVYVRDFPLYLGRLHGRSPVAAVRRELAANLYEEETGGLSLGKPHPDLFLKMMRGLGFPSKDFRRAELLPKSRPYRRWLDEVTLSSDWLEGVAVVTIFVEGSVHDRREIGAEPPPPTEIEETIRNHFLVRHHRVDPAHMDLIRAHHQVEKGHRIAAWNMVCRHARSRALRQRIVDDLKRSLELWLEYRDGVAEAAGVN